MSDIKIGSRVVVTEKETGLRRAGTVISDKRWEVGIGDPDYHYKVKFDDGIVEKAYISKWHGPRVISLYDPKREEND